MSISVLRVVHQNEFAAHRRWSERTKLIAIENKAKHRNNHMDIFSLNIYSEALFERKKLPQTCRDKSILELFL